MKLTVVGSGTSVPQLVRGAPCCLIQGGGKNIVADMGTGSVRGLLLHTGVSPAEVDLVLLTHLHPDHCADLVSFLFALRSEEMARSDPLLIFGPGGLEDHYRGLRRIWGHWVEAAGYDLAVRNWPGQQIQWGPFLLDAAPTVHSVENLAWFVGESGKKGVILTGDGEATEDLVRMGRGSEHVLVAECSLPVGEMLPGHMNPAQAGELAAKCGSETLMITHINPGVEPGPARSEAQKKFGGEVIVAEDGMEIEI